MIPLYPDPTLESTDTDLGLQQRGKDLYMPEPLFHALQKLHIQYGEELYFELITNPSAVLPFSGNTDFQTMVNHALEMIKPMIPKRSVYI